MNSGNKYLTHLALTLLLGNGIGCFAGETRPAISDTAGLLANTRANHWFQTAERALADKPGYPLRQRAKNLVLFIGDGMGISTITAARILAGQRQGLKGEEYQLSFERFPYSGLSKTYNVDAQTPDSAGTMTAMVSGVKTNMGLLGVDEHTRRNDCASSRGHELVTVLELAELAGKSTGIISTARVTHATPAAAYAKVAERNWESDADLPDSANQCEDIASQLIHFEAQLEQRFSGADSDGIDLVLGGGRRAFVPETKGGRRKDGRQLIDEWQAQYPRGHYLASRKDFRNWDPVQAGPVLGLFSDSHMRYDADRQRRGDEPSLAEMTTASILHLQQNSRGFLLIVEAGRIDHAHHAGNAFNALSDTIALSEAVASADALTRSEDTLIIVTADHSHVFTMAGYPKRGNPILGKVVGVGEDHPTLDASGQPYTTLGYTNGRGFQNMKGETDADKAYQRTIHSGRQSLTNIDTTAPGYHQEALVPLKAETHSGEDVAIFARGPGAALISGSNEQHLVFHVINHVAGLIDAATIP